MTNSKARDLLKSALPDVEPRTFDEVLGQAKALDGLGKKIRAGEHSGGVILHGPAGVGKRTVARLFAKALLCKSPGPSGSPCDHCIECVSFNESRSFGYAEFDAREGEPTEIAREIVASVRGAFLPDRIVVVIRNADLYDPQVADVFLKTLEEPHAKVTFVLLATVLKRMRVTVQSRSGLHRLHPLASDETKQLAKRLAVARGLLMDEAVLDLLALASRGLPGELRRLIDHFASDERITLPEARRKLGCDWGPDMIAYLCAIFDGREPPKELNALISAVPPEESIRRLGSILHHLYERETRQAVAAETASDPALTSVDESTWRLLGDRLEARARSGRISPRELWRSLVHSVLSGDHFEAESAVVASLGLRRPLTS